MKRFMMFSVGCLCLAMAVLIGFYLGSERTEAQTEDGRHIVGFLEFYDTQHQVTRHCVVLDNGDAWARWITGSYYAGAAYYVGNVLEGSGVIATQQSTWGNIKRQK